MTPEQRIAKFAKMTGMTVEEMKAHSMRVRQNDNALQAAKNAGATDAELIAIAKSTHK